MKQHSKPVLAAWMILLPFAAGMLVGQQITIRQFDPIVAIIENKDKKEISGDAVVTIEGKTTWEFTDSDIVSFLNISQLNGCQEEFRSEKLNALSVMDQDFIQGYMDNMLVKSVRRVMCGKYQEGRQNEVSNDSANTYNVFSKL